jgi:methylthioribose-1-phosphate isomerase
MRTIEWNEGVVVTIDQTLLPNKEFWFQMRTCEDVASALKEMKMRGAPLIGVAASYGIALTAYHSKAKTRIELMNELEKSAEILRNTRPTAVNLFWAINKMLRKANETTGNIEELKKNIVSQAKKMANQDIKINRTIGQHGSKLISDGDTVLTHCNAGALATVGYGTALGVIRAAWEQKKQINVFIDETRPKLQGARLTAYELVKEGIPATLITDNMIGYVMSKGLIDKVVVGADRILKDGVINKIGTFTVAAISKLYKIPFYVAAPISTFDFSLRSEEVVIEERQHREVTHFHSKRTAPKGVRVINPAFDITPLKFVEAIICEKGVLSRNRFRKFMEKKQIKG